MSVVLITGSCGLVGAESTKFFCEKGFDVVGVDNNYRNFFFGSDGDTTWVKKNLMKKYKNYVHFNSNTQNYSNLEKIFRKYKKSIKLIIHSAAQPSHDLAKIIPMVDFKTNAESTINLLELTKKFCPESPFIFMSTNKVYGDNPNKIKLIENKKRYTTSKGSKYRNGFNEEFSVDNTLHSLFGASKLSADIMTQEYGKYFGMKTVAFRGGCLTGPNHSGTVLHGFLSYLMKCTVTSKKYTIFGYKGKQVRDNIHSKDLIEAFYEYYKKPTSGEAYNMGGGIENNCSMLEAIEMCENITGKKLSYDYVSENRKGDHKWYISDLSKFKSHYPKWRQKYTIENMLEEIALKNIQRWS